MQISRKLGSLGRRSGDLVSRAVTELFGRLRWRLAEARRTAGRGRRMRVVESLALGGRRQLLLVRCDEQEYLVGTGPDSVETIVLRQREAGNAAGNALGAAQAGGGEAAMKLERPSTAGAGRMRAGAVLRDRPAPGPWLVTAPETGTMVKNRVREAGTGHGLGPWQ